MIYGVDMSNYQTKVDYQALKNSGIEFAILKASEGTTFKDAMFNTHYNGCKNSGMVVAAYHYVRAGNAQGQLDVIRSMVPTSVPIIPDVERGAGDLSTTRQLIDLLRGAGYTVPLVYIPEWYWVEIGRPSLAGLPPNWWSWYPDYEGYNRSLDGGINEVPSRIWNGFGGLPVSIIQFTSTGRVPGYSGNLDLNAFKGTRDELVAVLGGNNTIQRGDGFLMALADWQQERLYDRVLRMSKGVEGQNFNGEQWSDEQGQRDAMQQKLDTLLAKQDGLVAALAALSTDSGITVETVTEIINKAIAENISITGNIDITGKPKA